MSTTATATETSRLIGAYLVNGKMGNAGMPGAPIANFSLVVVPSTNSVSGTVEIKQALGSHGSIIVNVSGEIRATGYGKVTKVVSLTGKYVQVATPPAIGAYLANFSAHLAIDNDWNGQGGFSYGTHDVENVPVSKS